MNGLYSEQPWVFVAPTYAWQMPRVFANYIRKVEFAGNPNAYFVLTCGSDIGSAGTYASLLCQEKGLLYRGILEVVMPENYIAMFHTPHAEESRKIVEKAKPVLQSGVEMVRREMPFPMHKVSVLDNLKSGIVNKAFYKLFVKADMFYAKDTCTECGYCVTACPLNNIRLVEHRPVWGKDCTHCMACICGCPAAAVEYGKKSQGKPRYQCPKD